MRILIKNQPRPAKIQYNTFDPPFKNTASPFGTPTMVAVVVDFKNKLSRLYNISNPRLLPIRHKNNRLHTCLSGIFHFPWAGIEFFIIFLTCVHCSWLCRGGYPGRGGHIRIWGGQVQLGVDAEGGVHHQARARAIDHLLVWTLRRWSSWT